MTRPRIAIAVVVASAIGCALLSVVIGALLSGRARRPEATPPITSSRVGALVLHDVASRGSVHADLYVPKTGTTAAPWMVFAHERGWPSPDDKEREGAGIADALLRRGIGVAVVSFDVTEARPLGVVAEDVAEVVRELSRRAPEWALTPKPVLAGDELGATVVTSLALDARYRTDPASLRGVVAMNGIFDESVHPRADAPPFLLLASHGDSPRAAQSSRAFARALERAGASDVRSYFVGERDSRSLGNLSGDRNEVGDVVAAFVRGDPTPGGPESLWALTDRWGAHAPLTTEPFWADPRLVVRRPTDARFRAEVRNVFGEMMRDLEPWPAGTYDAIDLGEWLRAHPELGEGDWLVVTNARGEQLVLSRSEIDRKKPLIVIGIDDERNLFRLFVTYNVLRTYSWKPEIEARPLLLRSVGAFLYVPDESESLHVVTFADFALTTSSFEVVKTDPLAAARDSTAPLRAALTNEQGCLQCHALHGSGARAHHVRAADGRLAEGFGLALEEYPRDVLQRFLFEQDAVAKSFGVSPLHVGASAAQALFAVAEATPDTDAH